MIELPDKHRDTYWTTVLEYFVSSDEHKVELSESDDNGFVVITVDAVEMVEYPVESFTISDLNDIWRWLSDDARSKILGAYTHD